MVFYKKHNIIFAVKRFLEPSGDTIPNLSVHKRAPNHPSNAANLLQESIGVSNSAGSQNNNLGKDAPQSLLSRTSELNFSYKLFAITLKGEIVVVNTPKMEKIRNQVKGSPRLSKDPFEDYLSVHLSSYCYVVYEGLQKFSPGTGTVFGPKANNAKKKTKLTSSDGFATSGNQMMTFSHDLKPVFGVQSSSRKRQNPVRSRTPKRQKNVSRLPIGHNIISVKLFGFKKIAICSERAQIEIFDFSGSDGFQRIFSKKISLKPNEFVSYFQVFKPGVLFALSTYNKRTPTPQFEEFKIQVNSSSLKPLEEANKVIENVKMQKILIYKIDYKRRGKNKRDEFWTYKFPQDPKTVNSAFYSMMLLNFDFTYNGVPVIFCFEKRKKSDGNDSCRLFVGKLQGERIGLVNSFDEIFESREILGVGLIEERFYLLSADFGLRSMRVAISGGGGSAGVSGPTGKS